MESNSLWGRALSLPYQLLLIVLFFLLTVLWSIVSSLVSFFDVNGDKAHQCLTYWAKSSLAMARLRVEVEGLERLDPRQTYIFMPNHASFLDILLAFAHIPYNFRIITKEELFRFPFLGWALKRAWQIPMDRANPRKGLASLHQAAKLPEQGISVVVFPEGSRTSDGEIKDFKATLFILPIRTGTPVVPTLIEGTFAALKRGSVLLNRVPIKLTFYQPVPAGSFKDGDRGIYANKVRNVLISGKSLRNIASQPGH